MAQDALLRLELGDADPGWRSALIQALRDQLGWPPLGICQDETLQVSSVVPDGPGWRVHLRYTFDHDFASQYDKTWTLEGELGLDETGRVCRAAWARQMEP